MSDTYSFSPREPENYEQKTICCLVVDISGSMKGKPIDELNQGLQEFYQEILADSMVANRLEIALVTFGNSVQTVITPDLVYNVTIPTLRAYGTTPLVDGVREAIRLVDIQKNWYKQTGQPYLRPWIVLITDGAPDQGQDVEGLAQEIGDGVAGKRFVFFAVGVEHADMELLRTISTPQMPPAKLRGLRFMQFFQWLSASMEKVSKSREGDTVTFDSPATWWESGFTVD
jgi:uncharacterized protein YegL